MPSDRSFSFDLKLPQTPPTEDKDLYEQLQYVYKAILILADQVDAQIIEEFTPPAAASTGTKGTVTYDSAYLYICVATDTWRRVAHATW